MFKKVLALLLISLLFVPTYAYATVKPNVSDMSKSQRLELLSDILIESSPGEITDAISKRIGIYSDDELIELRDLILNELEERNSDRIAQSPVLDEQEDHLVGINNTAKALQKGGSGPAVSLLQNRLISLGYLSGTADGQFDSKTDEALRLFQQTAGLPVTGIADRATRKALINKNAPSYGSTPRTKNRYLEMDFKTLARNPDKYVCNKYVFSGKVIQVVEYESFSGTKVSLRVATKGGYDDVVYVTYTRKDGEGRILEDDKIKVYGDFNGLYTYTTILGASISLPSFNAESILLQ